MAYEFSLPSGETDYEFSTQLDDVTYVFRLLWNERDASWYLSVYDANLEPIALGLRCVLGVKLGGRRAHPFFANNMLSLYDSARSGVEAGIDDLGSRVKLLWTSLAELGRSGG